MTDQLAEFVAELAAMPPSELAERLADLDDVPFDYRSAVVDEACRRLGVEPPSAEPAHWLPDFTIETPRFTDREALEALADVAVLCAHYLLKHAGPDSIAAGVARSTLNVLAVEVAAALGDVAPKPCRTCGTTDPATSDRHAAHVAAGR